jgi:hypothetical protein
VAPSRANSVKKTRISVWRVKQLMRSSTSKPISETILRHQRSTSGLQLLREE